MKHSFSFRPWTGLIWEISAHWSVGSAWNFGARLFGKNPKIQKMTISNISRISGNSRKHVPKIIQGSTTQPLEPPARLRPPAARISRIWENWKNPISNISRIIENVGDFNFQYFQDFSPNRFICRGSNGVGLLLAMTPAVLRRSCRQAFCIVIYSTWWHLPSKNPREIGQ